MFEIAGSLLKRLDRGQALAVATVTRVEGSAPRQLGTSMAVDDTGAVIGSISGGCLEAEVYAIAGQVLETGRAESARFGIDDETAFSVGLSCGGDVEVLVHPLVSGRDQLEAALRGQRAGSAVIALGPGGLLGRAVGELTDGDLASAGIHGLSAGRLRAIAHARLEAGFTGRVPVSCEGAEVELFCEGRLAPPQMVLFGAVDFARALADAAALLGYRVSVVDARATFATPARFPSAAEVTVGRPAEIIGRLELDARSVIISLTHDPRHDIPVLVAALRMPIAYVGAMGSRRTHERRVAALREAGMGEAELARLHSPIGLDLGAASPEETAISILAEILRERTGASGSPLRETRGAIHGGRA